MNKKTGLHSAYHAHVRGQGSIPEQRSQIVEEVQHIRDIIQNLRRHFISVRVVQKFHGLDSDVLDPFDQR